MKRFRFPLSGVQRVREEETKGEQRKLAHHHRVESQAREKLEDAKKAEGKGMETARRQLTQQDNAWEVHQGRRHLEDLQYQRRTAAQGVTDSEKRTGQARQEFQEAERREKILERLRDRRYSEFVRFILRDEQKEMDEFASQQFRRRAA
ncbi:MAG: flagellar FliJ family protein [Candidatus Eisenbacteria bacterium]|uniref:Flagellar FliJ protein n=1 Tax=Eiseniibacteriota bacterium TaxID=2212470 RepID=A0A948RX95_UNCEI|nr:flagellar FliJ family protein [Candidatus Eisenbacteria bacterium]MBU1950946.1 flagellar FliJ family protein [Candidatus Eisenbacteria bacterium]MBU2692181.1 flagellar FliJ family protein [Candidatus Eisenbacteria bacterium]